MRPVVICASIDGRAVALRMTIGLLRKASALRRGLGWLIAAAITLPIALASCWVMLGAMA